MAAPAQAGPWTGKRYTAAGTVESVPIALTDGHLVAEGLASSFPLANGRCRQGCAKWVVPSPGVLGTAGTILSLETNGRRLAIGGQDVLLPDSRYLLPAAGTMDLFMDAGDFRDLLAAVEGLVGESGRATARPPETVTIAVHEDRHSPARVILGMTLLFAIVLALGGLSFLARPLFGDAALTVLLVVLPIVSFVTIHRLFRRGPEEGAYQLLIQGEQIEITSPKPSAPRPVVQARQVAVEHYEYVQHVGQAGARATYTYPVIELSLPGMDPLTLRTTDTTLVARIAWPGVTPPRGTPFLVGAAELMWLHEYFAALGRPVE